ncbi:MAG: hypothetical protein ABI639_05410 [Thermoanaerobaculia bacterium]
MRDPHGFSVTGQQTFFENAGVGIAALAVALVCSCPADAAGAVSLSSVRAQLFSNDALPPYLPEAEDNFSFAMAIGDFNGDGADDLATAMPGDSGPIDAPVQSMGAVIVRYGIPRQGLTPGLATTYLSQLAPGSPDPAQPNEWFGYALAAGDFDGDGRDDLAIGVEENSMPSFPEKNGAVEIHYGTATGIQIAAGAIFVQGVGGVPGAQTACGNRFGYSLTKGNFNGDAYDDLAVGAPFDLGGAVCYAGSVTVLNGSSAGVTSAGSYRFQTADLPQAPASGKPFGRLLASGDFDGNGADDLVVGADGENQTGRVYAIFGGGSGLVLANYIVLFPETVGEVSEGNERFGSALATGDFDADGHDDLVVGLPGEDFGPDGKIANAGEIAVLYGGASGAPNWFDMSRTTLLRESDIYPISATAQTGNGFGHALASGDFDRDGRADLAVGEGGQSAGGAGRGAVTVLSGASGIGLFSGWRFLTNENGVLPGTPQDHAGLGSTLSTGDFDGDGHSDLAIGVPSFAVSGIGLHVGNEVVVYGSLFSDGFALGTAGDWSTVVP